LLKWRVLLLAKYAISHWFLVTVLVLSALLATRVVLSAAAPPEGDEFRGRVVSPSAAQVDGRRQEDASRPVRGATVHLVPVTAIDITSRITASAIYQAPFPAEAFDEPLEDAIRLHGSRFPQTKTDEQGRFAVEQVPEGQYFIHVTPDSNDGEHLPGGDVSRRSYAAAQLRGRSMTITLSTKPSPQARTVGSSVCLSCHQDQRHWNKTAHKIGWTVPHNPGKMQDYSRHPEYFDALQAFVETDDYRKGTHLEIGDYDSRRSTDKFMLRGAGDTRLPLEKLYADLFLWKKKQDGKYYITLVNRLNANDPNSPADLEIKLLYGGAVHDQRYVLAVPPTLGNRPAWYTTLRYNMTGRDTRMNRQRRVWQDYKLDLWWNGGADARVGTTDDVIAAPPVNTNALQTMCAACHLTGWERYEDKATGQLLVRAVNDPAGDVNIDDDPELDEVNIGCERCHGPGSEHVAAKGSFRAIVNPKYLSAERSAVVCGTCHDRRQGYGGPTIGYTQPISKSGALARPGLSRHELITIFTDPVKKGPTIAGPGREDNIWPDDVHSSQPHQQYSDFLKSKMYRNRRMLVTCSDCHDMHGTTPYPRFLTHDAETSASALCQRCHPVDVLSHMDTKLNARMKGAMTRCIDCHMPGTAIVGGIAGDFGRLIEPPPYTTAAEEERNAYWEGPINSHVFDVPMKTNVAVRGVPPGRAMPIPYTSSCGTCHVVNELPFR
jgi:hypothetical protein